MSHRRPLGDEFASCPDVLFTSNTTWLEETDARRSESPEALLARLEEMLHNGELTETDVINYLTDLEYSA